MSRDKRLFHPSLRLSLVVAICTLLCLIILNWVFGSQNSALFYTAFNWRERVPAKDMVSSSDYFEEIWRKDSVFAGSAYGHESNYLASQNNDLYALVSFDPTQRESLFRLDMLSGEPIWQIPHEHMNARLGVTTLLLNSPHLYIGVRGGKAIDDSLIDAGRIVAITPDTGEFSWSRRIGGARGFSPINISDALIHVAGDFSSHYYVLDALSGEVVFKERKISEEIVGNGIPIVVEGNISYEELGCNFFRAINLELELTLWETALEGCMFQPVTVTDNNLFLLLGEISSRQLVAIDKENGNIAWKQSDVASNIALGDDSIIYFLTSDAELHAVDADSGELLDSIAFSGSGDERQANMLDYHTYPFSVTASENMVVVYFGDSAQLFAFSRINE